MKITILVLLFFFPLYLSAQEATVQGKVACEESGDAIIKATVLLKANGAIVAQTETDFHGNYAFREVQEGHYILVIKKAGYPIIHITDIAVKAFQQLEINPFFEHENYEINALQIIPYQEIAQQTIDSLPKVSK